MSADNLTSTLNSTSSIWLFKAEAVVFRHSLCKLCKTLYSAVEETCWVLLIHDPQRRRFSQLTSCTSSIPSSCVSATFPQCLKTACIWPLQTLLCHTSSALTARINFKMILLALTMVLSILHQTVAYTQADKYTWLFWINLPPSPICSHDIQFSQALTKHKWLTKNIFHTQTKIRNTLHKYATAVIKAWPVHCKCVVSLHMLLC